MAYRDTANAIRMALALETAQHFSLAALFTKLCQRTCDRPHCTNPAPYLDVFTLARLCVPCGNSPDPAHVPQHAWMVAYMYGLSPAQVARLPSFRSIPGRYTTARYPDLESKRVRMYDCGAAAELAQLLSVMAGEEPRVVPPPVINSEHRRLTLVLAPFLSAESCVGETVVRCGFCRADDGDVDERVVRHQRENWGADSSGPFPWAVYLCRGEYRRHLREVHGVDC
ncbi:hypothetical protein C7974DRAFT_414210 [Boeremia exigua]|uniref:uncharacterized protein n=1 Tax=Boeremia exigua TaxID=749465 RepID=UPI001E8CA9D5|nr:uncharacterized protein C7974DRAFT_414210 [Boeremia exigua]KAH6625714.1 hypothetical protein C7974DRAFT_414210 [Boeremia exigua]